MVSAHWADLIAAVAKMVLGMTFALKKLSVEILVRHQCGLKQGSAIECYDASKAHFTFCSVNQNSSRNTTAQMRNKTATTNAHAKLH